MDQIPSKSTNSLEKGLIISFDYNPVFHSFFDVDNVCDPIFSILVINKKWFGGKNLNIQWFRSIKKENSPSCCRIELSEGNPIPLEYGKNKILFDNVFTGKLPSNATDSTFSDWITKESQGKLGENQDCIVLIQFGSEKINLGDIPTGKTKPIIDCMFPILGGKQGDPDDDKVSILQVEKGIKEIPQDSVRIFVVALE